MMKICLKNFYFKIDAPLYEATKIELEKLYPKIQKGGVCIIDNYGTYKGIKKAVDEYFKNKISNLIIQN